MFNFRNENERKAKAKREALEASALKFQQAELCEKRGDIERANVLLAEAVQCEQIAGTIA